MCNARVFISPRVRVASSASAATAASKNPPLRSRRLLGFAPVRSRLPDFAGPIVFIGAAVSLPVRPNPFTEVGGPISPTEIRAIRIACITFGMWFSCVSVRTGVARLTDASKPSIHGSFSVARADP